MPCLRHPVARLPSIVGGLSRLRVAPRHFSPSGRSAEGVGHVERGTAVDAGAATGVGGAAALRAGQLARADFAVCLPVAEVDFLDAFGQVLIREAQPFADQLPEGLANEGLARLLLEQAVEVESAWLRDVERLLTMPIAILAHPFRYFPWAGRPVPRHLYRPVARMLAQAGIAAEINHHKNPFELDFFRACMEEGTRISLGTDAHVTRDIADLLPHLRTLDELGLPLSETLRPTSP